MSQLGRRMNGLWMGCDLHIQSPAVSFVLRCPSFALWEVVGGALASFPGPQALGLQGWAVRGI